MSERDEHEGGREEGRGEGEREGGREGGREKRREGGREGEREVVSVRDQRVCVYRRFLRHKLTCIQSM